MRIAYLFLFLTIIVGPSCKRKASYHVAKIKEGLIKRSKIQQDHWKKVMAYAEKDRAVTNVIEVSKDTIILVKNSHGLVLSVNNGKTWRLIGRGMYFNDLTIDDKGILWNLAVAPIHGHQFAYINKSDDLGETWKSTEFNINVFWPHRIYSKQHEPLQIITYPDSKVYQLSGNDPAHRWNFIKQLKEYGSSGVTIGADSVDNYDSKNIKLLFKHKSGRTDTIAHFKRANHIDAITKIKDTIYVSGSKCGKDCNEYQVYFAMVIKHKVIEYQFSDDYVYMRKTQLNHIWLLSSTGAYLKSGNKFIHLYK